MESKEIELTEIREALGIPEGIIQDIILNKPWNEPWTVIIKYTASKQSD